MLGILLDCNSIYNLILCMCVLYIKISIILNIFRVIWHVALSLTNKILLSIPTQLIIRLKLQGFVREVFGV